MMEADHDLDRAIRAAYDVKTAEGWGPQLEVGGLFDGDNLRDGLFLSGGFLC